MHEVEPPAGARGPGTPHGKTLAENSREGTPADGAGALKTLTPARHLAWLYSTDAHKPVLAALLEIETEIASGLRPGIEHHVAHARLQWWSEEAERVAQGRPVHPLGRQLVKARASGNGGVAGFVDTAVWDLASATFETRQELTAYCERWGTAMFETAAGAPSPWKTLGAAVREIELLANIAREAHTGRVRVPLDELDRAGIEPNALAKLPWPAPLATLLKERHQALRATLATHVATLAPEDQMASRGLLVWAALAWRLSMRAQRALPNVILPRRYDSLADGWQAWRTARRAAAGKLRLD